MVIQFAREGVQPPSPLYIGQEDTLVLTAFSAVAGATISLRTRVLTPDGTVVPTNEDLAPTSARAASAKVCPTPEGFILDATIVTTSTVPRGQLFCRLTLERGGPGARTLLATLISAYVSSNVFPAWPGSLVGSPLDGAGALRTILGTAPAAGAEVVEVVPTGARWRLRLLRVQLVTAVAAATRIPRLVLDDGANNLAVIPPTATQIASLTVNYDAVQMGAAIATDATEAAWLIPADVVLFAGYRIRTSTTLLQAADQYSAPRYEVEEWIDP